MEQFDLYNDISKRTGGDIYIGVVGPVRCGKSTFIKKFMELLFVTEAKCGIMYRIYWSIRQIWTCCYFGMFSV